MTAGATGVYYKDLNDGNSRKNEGHDKENENE